MFIKPYVCFLSFLDTVITLLLLKTKFLASLPLKPEAVIDNLKNILAMVVSKKVCTI